MQIISKSLSKLNSLKFLRRYSSSTTKPSNNNVQLRPSYYHNFGKEPLLYCTLRDVLDKSAIEYSNTEAIVSYHEKRSFTFQALHAEVDRLAAGFLRLGLRPGDYIGIWAPNNINWLSAMLAAARAGLVSVALNPAYQPPEIEYCLKKVNAKAIYAPETYKTQNYYEILREICPELTDNNGTGIQSKNLPHLKSVIIDTNTKLKGAHNFNDILDLGNSNRHLLNELTRPINPDSACNIQFTSGTTGKPKAALLSHFNIVNNGYFIGIRNQIAEQRICVQVPFFHVYAVVATISAALQHGTTLVIPAPGFDPEASLNAIVDEKCTIIHGTPTMYVDLVRKQRQLQLPINSAKLAVTGGAPCSPQLFQDIKNHLGLEKVHSIFGLTETTSVCFQSIPGDSTEAVLNTVGHLSDHLEVKITDTEGNIVPMGQPGELCIRGYSTMLGYFDDEVKTKETISNDKWLKTGDQFILQEDGYGRIVGRLKEMIIRGGENIFPKEVEDFFATHPNISDVYVIGVPDERMGEELCAFVLLTDEQGEKITADTLKSFAKGKLSHFKVPRYVIEVKDFPKTANGKIQKFKLLELYQKINS